jgi:phospholipid/cholesterol/gamma-HCH transport system substrate-binding protein
LSTHILDNPALRERRFVVRTGLFVSMALLVAMSVVVLIGKEKRLFARETTYRVAFENVDGLRVDSPVWLGGMDVGRVRSITFSKDLSDKRIQVELEIAAKFSNRIRSDSIARLTSRGVLGDKAVDLSLGSAEAAQLPENSEIIAGTSADLAALMKSGGEVMDNTLAITRDLRKAVAAYADPRITEELTSTIRSVRTITEAVEKGDGTLHALLFDPKTRQDVQLLLNGAGKTAQRLDGAVSEVEQILHGVRTGEGALHALIYDKKTGKAFAELGEAAGELSTLISDARKSPNGAIHQLIYGDSGHLVSDLGAMAADLRQITAKVRAGDGSLGALINDPTVYEDVKTILGNVKRNKILRALVRFSLSNGDKLHGVGDVQTASNPGSGATK